MRRLRSRSLGLALTLAVSLLSTVTLGLALAREQDPAPDDPKAAPVKDAKTRAKEAKDAKDAKAKDAKARRKGPVAPAGAAPKKNRPNAADPLNKNRAGAAVAAGAANANAKAIAAKAAPLAPLVDPIWPFHYKLKIAGADGTPLAATYYPARTRRDAPVVLLIHERGPGRSGKDWQEPLDELKGVSLAESLQEQGYAVLVPDLRGYGANPRKELATKEWLSLPADIQAMYLFLVDRHNRQDFNLAKFAVIGMGEGANLVTAWATLPGAAVSSEGRPSDLGALILVSPVDDAAGLRLVPLVASIANNVPMYVLCGDRDAASVNVVKEAQPIVERNQRSRVSYFDTPLHAYRLLHFFPKVPAPLTKFLDDPVKGRIQEWEPRYLLTPVAYENQGVAESKNSTRVTEATKRAAEAAKRKDEQAKAAAAKKKDDG